MSVIEGGTIKNEIIGSPSLRSNKKRLPKSEAASIGWLTDQGSNLDFSESKSDVLPITPSVNPNSAVQI